MKIDRIVERAKHLLLSQGGHGPTLFVEYSDTQDSVQQTEVGVDASDPASNDTSANEYPIGIILLTHLPEISMERQMLFFHVGKQFGEHFRQAWVRQLCFVSEVWASIRPMNAPLTCAPSLDPQRKEMLLVSSMEVPSQSALLAPATMLAAKGEEGRLSPFEETGFLYEMIRDGSGQLIDLLRVDELAPGSSTLFPALLAGVLSTRLPREELRTWVSAILPHWREPDLLAFLLQETK